MPLAVAAGSDSRPHREYACTPAKALVATPGVARRCGRGCPVGTVTLFGMCCSRGVFGHAYLNRVGAVCGSGSGVECGDIVPLSESVCHLGSPLGGTESMASWSKMP